MDIAEIRAKKSETEKAIEELLSVFMRETGVIVHAVDVEIIDVSDVGTIYFALGPVKLDVRV